MKKTTVPEITQETLHTVWEQVDTLRCKARRKAAISRIGGLLSNLLFLMLVVFLVNGLIYDRAEGSYCRFLKTLPCFVPFWEAVSRLVLTGGDSLYLDFARLLAADYLISALFFCAVAGLIAILYHPRKRAVPDGSYPEQTRLLLGQAQEAQLYASRTKLSASPFAAVLAILSAFVLFFSYAFYLKDANKVTALLSIFPTGDAATNALIYVLFGLILSGFLSAPLLLLTRFLYRYRIPGDLVHKAAQSAILAEPEIAVLDTDGRRNMAAELCTEAMALESSHMYQKAKEKYLRAAHLGNTDAMEHYARHCLIAHNDESAKYWLEVCTATAEASETARKMQKKLKLHRRPDVRYLDSTRKKRHTGIRAVLRFCALLMTLAVLAGTCYGGWLLFDSGKNPQKHQKFNRWMDQMRSRVQEELPELATRSGNEVAYYKPSMTLRPMLSHGDHSWEAPPLLHDNQGHLIPVCYSKDTGGTLYIPLLENWTEKVFLYTGEADKMQDISEYFHPASEYQALVAAEEFLLTLAPGEYCIMPQFLESPDSDATCLYAYGLLVEETSAQYSSLAGLSVHADENSQFVFDLEEPADLVLPFHSIGSNPIVGVRRVYPMKSLLSIDPDLEPEEFSVDESGSIVTIKQEYLKNQPVGDCFALEFIRADGRVLNMNHNLISIVQGEETGTFTIHGDAIHSLSQGGDYVASFEMKNANQLIHLEVSLNGEALIRDDLASGSDYLDFTSNTITIPSGKFQYIASPGECLEIRVIYTLTSFQSVIRSHTVEFTE